MSIKLISLTLNSPNPSNVVEFYSSLGFKFQPVKVSRGSELYRAIQGEVELCVFAMLDKKNAGTPTLQLGFKVENLDRIYSLLSGVAGVTTLMEPTDLPDGKMAILKDPDGNSIEITQF